MCVAVILALIVLPVLGGAVGYARDGATGAWVGALSGMTIAIGVAGGPFALMANAQRKKQALERADMAEFEE
jgi:hypothetical protein